MRGALNLFIQITLSPRIIPADAGSTRPPRPTASRRKDHPRGCGEHPGVGNAVDVNWGSSPRMRGAPEKPLVIPVVSGIIPADAGSTSPFLKNFKAW